MRVRGDDESLENALGAGGDVQIVPLFVPMVTFKFISERASAEGCTAGEFIERAIISYVKRAEEQQDKAISQPVRSVDVVIKKR